MPPDISFAEDQLPGNEPPLSNHTGEEHHVRLSPDPVTGQQAPTPWSPPIELSDEITIVSPIAHHISFSAPPTILNDQSLLSPPSPSRVPSTTSTTASTSTAVSLTSTSTSTPEPLSAYTCPICFSPPTNATLTPCGHICCGQCLFAAVKSTIRRNMVVAMDRAPPARCPVCRAEIPGWDGRGGGVVGLKMQVVYSL
ncbi:hypothetical protein PAXINDRAFT_92651 [Paxillus involutus ATCC 200175]|uniref:RING-type domain-containing protein n=1 Tax=Paxillus involutus ATCC 200175 TaxID=664439 RepID=A0A0C9TFF1_PAXIN|nr:hypothetical protein PAXINDRAFT_92651 [Paxillus involutus ATCC 200175]